MYTLKKKYPDGLELGTFFERYSAIFSTKKTIVYIKNEFDDSTFRYRFFNIKEAFDADEGNIELTCFLTSEIPSILNNLDEIDLIVLQRATWDPLIDTLLYVAKIKAVPVYYDIDDCIYKPQYAADYIYAVGVEDAPTQNHLILYGAKIDILLNQVEKCIVSNKILGKKIQEDFGIPYFLVKNGFNQEQKEASEYAISQKTIKDRKKFTIGYFSGSPSHNNDFRLAEVYLIRLMQKYENIYLNIVGYISLSEEWDKSGVKHKVKFEPKVSYQELQYKIAEVDVNIVPLLQTEFNDCKSELKFFEAALVNVVTCASPSFAYKNAISHGENGFLCSGEEWFTTIENIYLKNIDISSIIKNAYTTAFSNYDYKCIRSEYLKLLEVSAV
ncbi:hypothetical protein N5853_05455 [Bartonella sp. HY329]|uniref:glycosyltransferase n=1 Tax=unclassified Bartonella TaxID=2645622 RepID=UPI0021CADD45|nr:MULTISPECIES: hypothetical protein [unclassified Bartonella]UXM96065.1 hypothetical protein N5853_05455 [Bartonella sp. HY329]UXN10389.1 hypothetical protein N5852_05460 [Bartonella sp. HY328]